MNVTSRLSRKLRKELGFGISGAHSRSQRRYMSEGVKNNDTNHMVEEVKIRFPWGFICGKWWGPKDVRPIVALHGWQDNCGTFDTLAPLLPKNISLLAIDLPGHGLSSRVPDGMAYHFLDNLFLMHGLIKEYNWTKISLMGHSMGSLLAFTFASLFPENVDLVVGIDALKPQIRKPDRIVANIAKDVKNLLIADKRNQEKSEPPSYQYSELIDKLSEATFGSVTKEAAPFLLERAIKPSEKYPEKFFFARDSRLKHNVQVSFSREIILELIKRLHMPYLFIKCKDSPYYEDKQYFDEAIEAMKANEKFEWHMVEGTHHAHLTSPEVMSDIIANFLNKNNAVRSKL